MGRNVNHDPGDVKDVIYAFFRCLLYSKMLCFCDVLKDVIYAFFRCLLYSKMLCFCIPGVAFGDFSYAFQS